MKTLTYDLLRETLVYDPATGIFRWKIPRPKIRMGDIAGTVGKKGIRIGLYGRYYYAHRLAWLYVHGVWPKDQIDHEDVINTHNWIENLREATNGQNCANRRAFGVSGIKGATLHPCGTWHAEITHNKKHISLGYFKTAQEAHEAYMIAANKLHGEFARRT